MGNLLFPIDLMAWQRLTSKFIMINIIMLSVKWENEHIR